MADPLMLTAGDDIELVPIPSENKLMMRFTGRPSLVSRTDLLTWDGGNFSQAADYTAATFGFKLKSEVSVLDHPYLCKGDGGVTNNTTGLNAALAAAAGRPVRVPRGASFYQFDGGVRMPAGTTLIFEEGAELRVAARPPAAIGTFEGGTVYAALEATGSNVRILGKGRLRGPTLGAYVANEAGVFAWGANAAARGAGLYIEGLEVSRFGAYGVLTEFLDHIKFTDANIHDIGYAGALLSSASHVRWRDGEIGNIGPGTSGNAYGLTLSHNSTGYATDPNAGTKAAAHPFCWDVVIDGLVVYDVPGWQGIDAHGAYESSVVNCKLYNCRLGIAMAGGSGGAANYGGKANQVIGNMMTVDRRDGSATTVSGDSRTGITLNGGSVAAHTGVVCSANVIDGYGDAALNGASILAAYVKHAHIKDNTILRWAGRGIYSNNGGGHIGGNAFGAVRDATNSVCMHLDTTTRKWSVTNNRHDPEGGTAAAEGLRMASSNPRCVVAGNELESATAPYVNFTGVNTCGASDITPMIDLTGTPTTVDVSAAGRAPLVMVNLGVSGASTITDITGAFVGQRIAFYAPTSTPTTFNRAHAALVDGNNWVSSLYDTLTLICIASSGIKFAEVSRSANL